LTDNFLPVIMGTDFTWQGCYFLGKEK